MGWRKMFSMLRPRSGFRPAAAEERSLDALRQDWDMLGVADPYWAILADPSKKGNRWDPEEFMATGVQEIEQALAYAKTLPVRLGHDRALDFGCGLGRLSRALAKHFNRVDGVDISEEMLQRAGVLNRCVSGCRFHHVTTTQLPFKKRTFDFVYSRLVLQHMNLEFAIAYVKEFMRVLKPGALAVFQAPSRNLVDGRASVASPVSLPQGTAYVEMHAHPREAIERAVASAGGSVLDVRPDNCAGDAFESVCYAATRLARR